MAPSVAASDNKDVTMTTFSFQYKIVWQEFIWQKSKIFNVIKTNNFMSFSTKN